MKFRVNYGICLIAVLAFVPLAAKVDSGCHIKATIPFP